MKNRKIEDKTIKQIAIDLGLHQLIKIESAKAGKSIRELVEECLIEYLDVVTEEK